MKPLNVASNPRVSTPGRREFTRLNIYSRGAWTPSLTHSRSQLKFLLTAFLLSGWDGTPHSNKHDAEMEDRSLTCMVSCDASTSLDFSASECWRRSSSSMTSSRLSAFSASSLSTSSTSCLSACRAFSRSPIARCSSSLSCWASCSSEL